MRIFMPQAIVLTCAAVVTSVFSLSACSSEMVAPDTPLPVAWQVPLTDTISQPSVSDNTVFIIDEFGKLIALDVEQGTQRWKNSLAVVDHGVEPVGVQNGQVFVTEHGDEGRVLAFDAQTGEQQWDATFGPYRHGEHPIAHEGMVYFEATGPEALSASLRAVESTTGELRWDFPVGSHIATSPLLGNDLVYFGAYDFEDSSTKARTVYALDKATGEPRWTYPSDLDLSGKFALDDTHLYIGADGGVIIARDAATGGPGWTARVGQLSNSPSVADGLVYVGNKEGEMIALNADDGTPVWSVNVGSPVLTQAAMADGILYFGTQDGHLYALDSLSGEEMWKEQSPVRENPLVQEFVPAMGTTPVVADDLLLYFNSHALNALKLR